MKRLSKIWNLFVIKLLKISVITDQTNGQSNDQLKMTKQAKENPCLYSSPYLPQGDSDSAGAVSAESHLHQVHPHVGSMDELLLTI